MFSLFDIDEKDRVDQTSLRQNLYGSCLGRDWQEVIRIYETYPEVHAAKITKSQDTALHVAVNHSSTDVVEKLVAEIEKTRNALTTLAAKNKRGDTPLHSAASRGYQAMCDRILVNAPTLISERNKEGETPLFLAAFNGYKETFLYLHEFSKNTMDDPSTNLWRRNGGETILHCTIEREYYELAFLIIRLYKDQLIGSSVTEKGVTPLHVLACKPSAFLSGTNIRWWNKILYYCIIVEPLKDVVPSVVFQAEDLEALTLGKMDQTQSRNSQGLIKVAKTEDTNKDKLPNNYHTFYDFYQLLRALFQVITSKFDGEPETGESAEVHKLDFPQNYHTCLEIFKSAYKHVLGLSGIDLLDVRKIKEKHVWCAQIMDELLEQLVSEYGYLADGSDFSLGLPEEDRGNFPKKEDIIKNDSSSHGTMSDGSRGAQQNQQQSRQEEGVEPSKNGAKKEVMTALLTAAKYGVVEMVKKILHQYPVAIHDTTTDKKNILLVAVENRQPRIFEALRSGDQDVWYSLVRAVDSDGNNVLHLAAKVSKLKPWKIPGSAMQMQWEIKWFQYVKESVPKPLTFQTNDEDLTPAEFFNENHQGLVKDGSDWLKSTSESCSVVAALVAGVSFATSSAVPGGTSETGKPTLEGKPAFNVFSITSLFALCSSLTALIMFLAILTSRQQSKDFRRDLPFKLLLGLSSLFVSIAAMLVSFCAAHFFVLQDELSGVVFFIYAATCLPVSIYAVAQFPLYWDLMKAILTKVPQSSYREDDL